MESSREDKQVDRLKIIRFAFIQAYFGHVIVGNPVWNEIERYCEDYISSAGRKQLDVYQEELRILQTTFVQILQNHPLSNYPVSGKHKMMTLQWITKLFSKCDIKQENELYHFLPSGRDENSNSILELPCHDVITKDNEESEYTFKSFYQGDNTYITLLEENRDFIGHGTTGLTSWQGAMCLTNWCLNQSKLFEGKNIIELGSGTGYLGMSLLKTLKLGNYTFTDCHHLVLNALIFNLKLNIHEQGKMPRVDEKLLHKGPPCYLTEKSAKNTKFHVLHKKGEITVEHLDWTDFEKKSLENCDILLGSDIVYERSILKSLCTVLKSFMASNQSPLVFIACTERSHKTLRCFEEALVESNLSFKIIHRMLYSPAETILSSDVLHQPTRIYEIFN